MMFLLNKLKPNSALTVRELKLEPQAFKAVLSEHIMLINKALQNSFVIKDFEGFCEEVDNMYNKVGLIRKFPSVKSLTGCNFYHLMFYLHFLVQIEYQRKTSGLYSPIEFLWI